MTTGLNMKRSVFIEDAGFLVLTLWSRIFGFSFYLIFSKKPNPKIRRSFLPKSLLDILL